MFLRLNRQNKKLRELCGTTLIGLKWLDVLHEKRNAKCSEVAEHAESLRDPSQRITASKRSLCAGHDFPELVMLSLQTADGERAFSCPVLFTLDCRHTVAIQLDQATVCRVVACMSQCIVHTRKTRPRAEWVSFKHPALRWSYERKTVYVLCADADGQWHRRSKRPIRHAPSTTPRQRP